MGPNPDMVRVFYPESVYTPPVAGWAEGPNVCTGVAARFGTRVLVWGALPYRLAVDCLNS